MVPVSHSWGFAAFLCIYLIMNWIPGADIQTKHFEEVIWGSGKLQTLEMMKALAKLQGNTKCEPHFGVSVCCVLNTWTVGLYRSPCIRLQSLLWGRLLTANVSPLIPAQPPTASSHLSGSNTQEVYELLVQWRKTWSLISSPTLSIVWLILKHCSCWGLNPARSGSVWLFLEKLKY